ncbi:MAG TPA: acyl-CoA thioesterase, partial [Bacillota bacterium]|nr:acyl-CoA thioesterase [Bacillota bacterium]
MDQQSTISFRVRYQETDRMGVVHHSVYYIWYEMGRTEWLRQRGLPYTE